jgi:hypothetical protein
MGYSLDSSTDTTVVLSTSINATVPASVGPHTVHVKAWGANGSTCDTDVAITVNDREPDATSSGGITISAPASGASVATPFALTATAKTCSSQSVTSMGYSLDSSASTTTASGESLNVKVTAAAGSHTLHVKSWGNKGAGCSAAIPIKVTGASSAPPTGTDGITVSSPTKGSTVSTSFSLEADATKCSNQTVTAMGYSLDSSADTTIVDKQAVGATVTTSAGAHTLHVKSWGSGGAGCDADLPFTAAGSGGGGGGSTGSDGITITSPSNGADVSSGFTLAANAKTCSSQAVTAMGYSLDSSSSTSTFNGTSFSADVSASAGAHTVHVKSWGNKGAGCSAEVAVTVSGEGGGGGDTPVSNVIPSNAKSVSSIQVIGSWKAVNDTGASGSSSGKMYLVKSPAISGNAREFVTKYSNAGGERYEVSFGDDDTSTNFFYDAYVYVNSSVSDVANIEMDMNQTMPNGQTVTFGFQCDGYSGTWDYTKNAGSPSKPKDTWVHSSQKCNPRSWSKNTWHHVQVYYSRNGSGVVTYHDVWLDNKEQTINATVPSAFALGWGRTLLTNFQVDGLGKSGSSTVYVDKITVSRW